VSRLFLPCVLCVPPPRDADFGDVVQLAHFDGSNNSTTFTNSCPRGNTITRAGSSVIATAQSVFGGASLRIPSGDDIEMASHADYAFGTSDLTIEFRMRVDSVTTANILDMRANGPVNTVAPTIYMESDGKLVYYVNGAARITSAASVVVATTWQAIAVSRIGTSTKLFVDGTQVGSTYTDGNDYVQQAITMGRGTNSSAPMSGVYFDELRITNGTGRYSGNYTPATAPFPNG
jgi:Concanavalin A-like lectin/glucanases superfamily